jgi:hypothetical protein
MEIIFNKIVIDLITQDNVVLNLPTPISIDELYYEIEYNPEYSGISLFIDVIDGEEKLITLILNESGFSKSILNPNNLFKTENFKVEKIIFDCFRKLEFVFTLKIQDVK